jgi:alpha-ketoglutarate-dependent taurine dioxygenase
MSYCLYAQEDPIMSTVRIERLKPHIGGIVRVAKEHLLDDQTVAAVREALEDRGVLVFPRMFLTDSEQLAFTDRLGKRVNFTRKAPGTRRSTSSPSMCWVPSSGTSTV